MLDKNISLAWPKISVVTPSFNQGKYIEQTILSVIEQHYPNIEYIVIDGGSNDETNHILAKYADTIDYCVSEPDKGQSHAINKGFAVATGDIFCWLNSDDQFAPDALKSVALAYLEKKADVIAGICEVYQDDKLVHRHFTSCQDGPLPLNEILDLDNGWNAGQFFYQPEVFFTRELWQKAGGAVNEDCFYSMDYELWCRFALHQANLVGIGVPLVHFRMHSEQKTADEAAFKSELINVRDRFLLEHNINWTQSERPPVNWSRKLKVAFINDLGYKFGAGTAQLRMAGAFDLAGQDCSVFDLLTYQQADGSYRCLFGKVAEFDPDVVIFGNLHAITPNDISVLKSIEQLYPTYWLTHDFWLLTGRCPYPSNCTKYITGCDSDCPTKDAYPVIASDDIARSWQSKHEFLSATNQLTILANSEWSKSFIDNALPKNASAPTDLIRLGAPVEIFKPQDKWEAKKQIGVEKNSFTIAFSVSSLSDLRKGGDLLLGALKLLSDMNITLLLIGRLDVNWEFPNVKCISLGYIDNVKQLVLALNAADLYVGPSREETFGQVFIEAALCGTPSLGFSASGVTDAIIDNVTGFKLESQTAEALAAAIESLYLSPDTCLRIAELAPIYARAFYSLEASYRTFFNVLDRQNVIDTCKAPHKISFSATSDLVANCTKGWVALSWFDNLNWKLRGVTTRLIGCFSPEFTSKVRQSLPKWLEKRVMIWLLGK